MTQQFQNDDEPQFAVMLHRIEDDAAPVDGAALNRIREMLLREMTASMPKEANEAACGTKDVVTELIRPLDSISPISETPDRSDAVVTLTRMANEPPQRGPLLSAIVVAAVLLVSAAFVWVTQRANSVVSPLALASVLDEVAMADSLRIEAVVSGTTEEILVKQPSQARWQVESGRYRVLDGTRFWSVDESENVAQLEPNALLKRVGTARRSVGAKGKETEGRISLLEVLGIEAQQRDLIRALPVKQAEVEGVACSFYDATVPALVGGDVAGDVRIEAVVETLSRRVRSLTVWPAWYVEGKRAPIADVQLLALNEPVNEAQFVLAKSLSQDGRIGKISDTQGVVTLRPALHERWTPICQQMLLKPGDSLRTDLRGPNAVQVTLTSEVQITIGPGSFVECVSPFEVRLLGGELQVKFSETLERDFKLAGPKGQSARWDAHSKKGSAAHEAVVVRLNKDEKLTELKTRPAWLNAFEGAMVGHKLGALIANVDGRNEPLTIGYHKVNVEIRDQIARTTIEESFVNHTGARLEGVFHFPLPSDASISGFGMWIGNQLVEADIVEKQRAREIFETILRERRDPGLLEWTAGNLFKARVFPIEPHSEKRIKIVYTQVLPLRGGKFRYSYGLQSDLLKLHPVRELAIDVLINSTLPISRIECPTHDVQTRHGKGHSSQVTFNAREYVPTRDFEVVCQLDGPRNDVVVVPHQRGDDGYLLVQITPPSTDGNWQREVLPNGEPVELLLLCDTSGSMDSGKRKQQAEFVAALLASLGEKDRFNLAGCDVGCVWAFAGEKSVPATAANVEVARKFLSDRGSLGWTDLGRAFEDVRKKASEGTQIVYVGDGIVTAGNSRVAEGDWQGNGGRRNKDAKTDSGGSKELDGVGAGKVPGRGVIGMESQSTLHAVSVGNVVEAAVLKNIAAASGGSMRAISGEMTPQKVALELLNEIAQPGIRDLQIEFRGVPVAAVYPSKLPNLAAGTQQMVLARYLPVSPFAPRKDGEGNPVAGGGVARTERPFAERKATMPLEVVVTGKRGKETVKYSAKTSFAEAEEGNSFIPRLWARLHLDQLLSQGRNQAIQDEIIRLSEEFHIITPYTSLLVLESDADRERFGVKRRYEMRDGERFFADGRDNAKYELRQQYIAAERAWREGLRRAVLKSFASLGRDPQIQQRLSQMRNEWNGRYAGLRGATPLSALSSSGTVFFSDGGMLGGYGGFGGGEFDRKSSRLGRLQDLSEVAARDFDSDGVSVYDESAPLERLSETDEFETLSAAGGRRVLSERLRRDELELAEGNVEFDTDFAVAEQQAIAGEGLSDALSAVDLAPMNGPMPLGGALFKSRQSADYFYRSRHPSYRVTVPSLFGSLLPELMPARQRGEVVPDPKLWPKEMVDLANGLLRTDSLLKLPAGRGIEVRSVSETTDKRWGKTNARSEELVLFAPSRWLRRPLTPGSHDVVQWRDEKDYGTYSTDFGVGQVRKVEDFEKQDIPIALEDFSLSQNSLLTAFGGLTPNFLKIGGDSWLIDFNRGMQLVARVKIHREDRVVTKVEYFDPSNQNVTTRTIEFSDFVTVAGRKWAKLVTTTHHNAGGDTVTTTRFTITEHDAATFDVQFKLQNAARGNAEFIRHPLPSVAKAKAAIANRKGKLEDRLVVLAHFASSQQWDNVFEQLAGIDSLPAVKDSVAREWLRTLILKRTGRNEEARQRLNAAANVLLLSKSTTSHVLTVAQTIRTEAYNILSWEEYARLIQKLMPLVERQTESADAKSDWQNQWLQCLRQLGHWAALREQMIERLKTHQWDIGLHQQFAQDIANGGDLDAARAYLEQQRTGEKWNESERRYFRDSLLNLLRGHHRRKLAVEILERELVANPQPVDEQFYVIYLSELYLADRETRAHELMHLWMKEARVEKPTPLQLARLRAAVRLATGNGDGIYWGRIDERFMPDLTEIARYFAGSAEHHSLVNLVVEFHSYTASDELIRLRGEWFGFLKAGLKTLKPGHLAAVVNWVLPNEPRTTSEDWISISAAIRERWQAETDDGNKHVLGSILQAIYSQRLAETHLLPFLRERLKVAAPVYRSEARQQLFDALQRTAWSVDNEREALALIPQLGEVAAVHAEGSATFDGTQQVIALHQWVDAMLSARQAAAMKTLLATGHPEKLTRTEYAAKKAEFLKAAREGVSESLRLALSALREEGRAATAATTKPNAQAGDAAASRNQMPSRGTATLEELLQWMTLERGYLDLQLGRDPAPVLAEAWALLGESPIETTKYASVTMPMLKQRAFVVVMNLTCRRTATEADVARLMKFLDVGIYSQSQPEPMVGEEEEDEFDIEAATWRWKKAKFDLLVALDRPEALERELEKWIKRDSSVAPWRKSLARLKAERGDLKAAIELFEAVRRSDELLPADQATLAKWYLAGDRRADYEQTRIAYWKTMPDYQINNALQSLLQPYRRNDQPRPSTLDENVLFALRAIFEKSTSPGSYLYQLREFYDATRDFRLMGMLPETVVGKTPQQVYSVLQQVSGEVLVELRDEATSDELLKGIRAVAVSLRDSAAVSRSGTATDLRALDLLEALVERKASEVLNQPGPHVTAALAALQRAFDREWATGEQRQMADLLAALGSISQKPLADEQVRQLTVLAQQAAVGSDDHVFINAALARAMTNYGQRDRALTVLGHAVREYERTHESGWPAHAVGPMSEYLNLLMDAQKCSVAEEIVLRHIAKPENDGQREYFKHRLVDVYQRAYASDQRVSLGEGEALLKSLRQHLLTAIERANEARKAHYMQSLVGLCSSAKDRHPEVARQFIREFAFEQLPTLLTDHPVNFESVISNTAETVKALLGSKTALEFLIERLEQYPRRSFYGWNTPWQQHGTRIAELRQDAVPLGKYEERLLKLVLDELRADLRQRDNRSNRLFRKHDHLYWTAKEHEFVRVSNEVLAERPDSGQTAVYVSGYLYAIGHYDRAIEILFDFDKKGVLREQGLSQLVHFLHGRGRYAESIGVLEPLIARSPDTLWYRTHLMRAYHHSARPQMLADLLKATDAHFRAGGRWAENVAAELGSICNETRLPEPAVGYLQEAIAMHLREGQRRDDWALWGYYRDLASALTQLNRTQEAVEAAAAGVVMWPGHHHYRQETLNNLVSTLRQAPDIDAYAKWLDEQAEKDKQERPLIRKSLGRAYRELNEHAKAVAQLRIAADLTPQDRELQRWLLESLDKLQQKDAALAQLKQLVELDPRNLDWHKQLAERLASNEAEAERAATSIVEALPTEAESHQTLAAIRESQSRWTEAIVEWQQVAELRALEPTGLLGLANAQLKANQFEACDATLDRLTKTKWDARFNTVKHQTEMLRAQLRAAQKM